MSEEDTHSSDFTDDDIEDDDEATLAEEEALGEFADSTDELRMLNEESELSVEELRRRYGYGDAGTGPAKDHADIPSSSSSSKPDKPAVKEYFTDEALADDEEDDDYVPRTAEYWKKDVRIGADYQVSGPLPESKTRLDNNYIPFVNCVPLWLPGKLSREELDKFFITISVKLHELEANGCNDHPQANRTPKCDVVADDEDALFALLQANYNVEEALGKVPFTPANGPKLTAPFVWKPISNDDADRFENAFREYGKNFFQIQANSMKDRTVGELVNFYYIWKKTERHDMYIETNRALGLIEPSKKTIDPMDVLADQQLDEVNGSSAPTSSNGPASQSSQKTWLSVQHQPRS